MSMHNVRHQFEIKQFLLWLASSNFPAFSRRGQIYIFILTTNVCQEPDSLDSLWGSAAWYEDWSYDQKKPAADMWGHLYIPAGPCGEKIYGQILEATFELLPVV
jgi:hypothetical protein